MRLGDALQILRPAAQWVAYGDEYKDIIWMDTQQTIPTESEVIAKMAEEKPEPTVAEKLASVGLSVDDLKAALGL